MQIISRISIGTWKILKALDFPTEAGSVRLLWPWCLGPEWLDPNLVPGDAKFQGTGPWIFFIFPVTPELGPSPQHTQQNHCAGGTLAWELVAGIPVLILRWPCGSGKSPSFSHSQDKEFEPDQWFPKLCYQNLRGPSRHLRTPEGGKLE